MATLFYLTEYNSYFFGIALPNGLTCSQPLCSNYLEALKVFENMLLSWSNVHKLCCTLSILLLISLFEKQSKWKCPFELSYAQLSSVAFLLILSYTLNLCVVTRRSPREVLWHHKEQLWRRLPFCVKPNSSFCDMKQKLFAIHKNFLKNPAGK